MRWLIRSLNNPSLNMEVFKGEEFIFANEWLRRICPQGLGPSLKLGQFTVAVFAFYEKIGWDIWTQFLLHGGGNLNKPIVKCSNARVYPGGEVNPFTPKSD